jgi:hypothetical protein
MKGLPASTGLMWLKQGFALFRQQPGILMMLIFTNLLIGMLLSTVPILGPLVGYLAIPSFTMAIQQSCRLIDEGQRVHPRVLLTGFRKDTVGPLFKLGGVYLGVLLVLMLCAFPFVDLGAIDAAKKMVEAKQQPVLDGRTTMAITTFMIMLALSTLALSFAPGLTHWKRMPTFKAVFYSFFAVLGSKAPIAVMLLAWLGLYGVARAVIGLVFGSTSIMGVIAIWMTFIAILIFHCAVYVAYKQILGAPEDDPAPAAP